LEKEDSVFEISPICDFILSVGKNLALLQAEVSVCVSELANVPNARRLFLLFAGRQNKNSIKFALSFLF